MTNTNKCIYQSGKFLAIRGNNEEIWLVRTLEDILDGRKNKFKIVYYVESDTNIYDVWNNPEKMSFILRDNILTNVNITIRPGKESISIKYPDVNRAYTLLAESIRRFPDSETGFGPISSVNAEIVDISSLEGLESYVLKRMNNENSIEKRSINDGHFEGNGLVRSYAKLKRSYVKFCLRNISSLRQLKQSLHIFGHQLFEANFISALRAGNSSTVCCLFKLENIKDLFKKHRSLFKLSEFHLLAMEDQIEGSQLNGIKNEPDADGWFPIHYAAANKNPQILKEFLLQGLCDPMATNHKGETALHIACKLNRFESVDSLLKLIQKEQLEVLDVFDKCGFTAFHHICKRGHVEAFKSFERTLNISQISLFEAKSSCTMTPVMIAARHGNLELVRILLDYNVSLKTTDQFARTAVHYATMNGHKQILELILSKDSTRDHMREIMKNINESKFNHNHLYLLICIILPLFFLFLFLWLYYYSSHPAAQSMPLFDFSLY